MEDRNWYIAGIAVPKMAPPMSGRHGYRQDSLMSEPWLVGYTGKLRSKNSSVVAAEIKRATASLAIELAS